MPLSQQLVGGAIGGLGLSSPIKARDQPRATHNGIDKVVTLAVEPWADVVMLAPEARTEFEYDEPAEVTLSLLPEGEAAVSVMSDRLKYSANGREEEWKDTTGFLTSHLKNKE